MNSARENYVQNVIKVLGIAMFFHFNFVDGNLKLNRSSDLSLYLFLVWFTVVLEQFPIGKSVTFSRIVEILSF